MISLSFIVFGVTRAKHFHVDQGGMVSASMPVDKCLCKWECCSRKVKSKQVMGQALCVGAHKGSFMKSKWDGHIAKGTFS